MTNGISKYDPSAIYPGRKKFDCGVEEINKFVEKSLNKTVKNGFSVAYILTDSSKQNHFVGFYTLSQYSICVELLGDDFRKPLPRQIPCTRLVMLGVSRDYQKNDLGSKLMTHALRNSKEISSKVGSFGVYLDAYAPALGFYQKIGFKLLSDRSPDPSPMFLHIDGIPHPNLQAGMSDP